jgi:type IV secretion system protein VirD4
LLDEFSNVALPDDYCSLLSTMRSREISSVIIIQNLAQIKALFKDTWETIPGNCDTLVYLGGNEQSTHKYISELLGKGTINKRSSGETKGRQGSSSRNYDVLGRELFTPDEVRKLDNKKCLIFIRGLDPILDRKYIPFAHPAFPQTADGAGIPYVHIPVQKRKAERNSYELLSPKALSYYEGLKEKGETVYMDNVSYEEFEILTEMDLKKRFLSLDEIAQREKYHREQAQELEYAPEPEEEETGIKSKSDSEKEGDKEHKIGHNQPKLQLQGEDTIMNRMAQWQYSKEQKAELHKMIALGMPQKRILELFYPDTQVARMKEGRRTYRPMQHSE